MNRRIILVRHADALPAHNGPDAMRTLSPSGRKNMYKTAQRLVQEAANISQVISSPFARAIQTAEILISQLDWETPLTVTDKILAFPPDTLETLSEYLATTQSNNSTIVVVGHQPTLSLLAALLLKQPNATIPFSTGQATLITEEAKQIKLEWTLSDGQMRYH